MKIGLVNKYRLTFIALVLSLSACSGGGDSDDTTPDAFTFEDETEIPLGEVVISEPIIVEGINAETTITIEGGEYSINGADFTDEEGEVEYGDYIYVQLEASEEIDTETEATVTIGGVEDTFVVTTVEVALVVTDSFKALSFSWDEADGADYYRLLFKADADSDFEQVGRNILPSVTGLDIEIPIHLYDWYNAEYELETCTNALCSLTDAVSVYNYMLRSIGYIKAPNPEDFDEFAVVKISSDGNTLVIGAPGEDGGSKGLNGDVGNNSLSGSGAIYIYVKEDDIWNFQAYIKAPNTEASDAFGSAVAISIDGNTVAVGAPFEDGGESGIDGDYNDNSVLDSGAVFVYQRAGSTWALRNYIKSPYPSVEDNFGETIALSAYGSTLVVGVKNDDGEEITPDSDTLAESGALFVYSLAGDNWEYQAYLKAPNADAGDEFGSAVSINANGNLILASSEVEASSAKGVDGTSTLNDAANAGAAYTFVSDGTDWSFESYIKASNTNAGQHFGSAVALSMDGETIAIGASADSSNAIGVDGVQTNTANPDSGAAFVFRKQGGAWLQNAYIKSSNGDIGDAFGSTVSLSWDGTVLAVGAPGESSFAEGVSGNEADNTKVDSGAVYVFADNDAGWEQEKYVKAPNTDESDGFGLYLSLDSSGETLVVGAPGEQSSSTLFEDIQTSNSNIDSGAVYLY